MKKEINWWVGLLGFIAGSLICYIALQFSLFEIDFEIKVVESLISIGTAIIALYIAISIQRRLAKNQNQYTYVEKKIDNLWSNFNAFSQSISFNDNIEVSVVSKYSKEALHTISFVKDIFSSYELNLDCITNLETKIDDFDKYILALPINDNIISLSENKSIIDAKIHDINQSFSIVLKFIQNI
jgi:hypothetical protein